MITQVTVEILLLSLGLRSCFNDLSEGDYSADASCFWIC